MKEVSLSLKKLSVSGQSHVHLCGLRIKGDKWAKFLYFPYFYSASFQFVKLYFD